MVFYGVLQFEGVLFSEPSSEELYCYHLPHPIHQNHRNECHIVQVDHAQFTDLYISSSATNQNSTIHFSIIA